MWCLREFVKESHNQRPSVKLFLSRACHSFSKKMRITFEMKIELWHNTICFSTRGVDSLYEIIKFFLQTVYFHWMILIRQKKTTTYSQCFTLIWIKGVNAVKQPWHLMRKTDAKPSSVARLLHDLKVWLGVKVG